MITVRAHSNIALIKYWGKRDAALKLPLNGSISLTLDQLYTETRLGYDPSLRRDQLFLNGEPASESMRQRVSGFLDLLRSHFGFQHFAEVHSHNSFPTGAGLASSASAFAALALAATTAQGLQLAPAEVSRWARQGSGSACRSLFGGFVEWRAGERPDGQDSFAQPLEIAWPVQMLVLVLQQQHKAVGSGDGMARTVASSPLYPGWLASIEADLADMRASLQAQDFEAVGSLMEHNALKMHASALAARPAVLYWQPETLAILHLIWQLRAEGHACYATLDAGPNVKVLLPPASPAMQQTPATQQTIERLIAHPAVQQHFLCQMGPAAQILEPNP